MAGISAQTCINLILQHIGGIPLKPTNTALVEGSPVTKQLGMAGYSLPGLETLQGAFNGASTESLLGNVFQNPVGGAIDTLSDSVTSAAGAIENAFVTTSIDIDPITGLETEIRSVSGALAGKISIEEIDALQTSLQDLGGVMPDYKTFTDKMAGVKLPNYETAGDFGLQQVVAVQGSYENLASRIPADLDAQVGGLSGAITDNLGKITQPLNLGESLSSTSSFLDTVVSQLESVAPQGSAAVGRKYDEIMDLVASTKSLVNTSVNQSRSVMGTFVNGSQAMGYVETASGGLMGGSGMTTSLINQVVKPTPLAQMKDGIARYAPSTLADVGTVVNPPTF